MWTDFNSFTFGFADKLRNKVKIKSSTAPEFCCRTTLWKLPSMRGSKNGGDKGDQASHDFLGWQNCSPPRAPITHATPLQGNSTVKDKHQQQIRSSSRVGRFKSSDFLAKKSYNLKHKDLSSADYFVWKKSITNMYTVKKIFSTFLEHSMCILDFLYVTYSLYRPCRPVTLDLIRADKNTKSISVFKYNVCSKKSDTDIASGLNI